MKVLVLAKAQNESQLVLDYATQVQKQLNYGLHALSIIRTPDEIPTQMNGEVLENCTEFDLQPYEHEKERAKSYFREYFQSIGLDIKHEVLIGLPFNIIKDRLEKENYDLILSAAKLDENDRDFWSKSFAEKVMDQVDIPYLSLKCHREISDTKTILIFRDVMEPEKRNLQIIDDLQKELNVQLKVVNLNTKDDFHNDQTIKENTQRFIELNNLSNTEIVIKNAVDKTEGVKEAVEEYDPQMIVLGKCKDARSLFGNDWRGDVVNHISQPILVY